MPRTKGSKNRPKTNITKDYASQITEKQETIACLNTEIASITSNIDTLKADLKEKKTALKKAEKEVACGFARLDLFTSTCFCLSWCVMASVFSGVNGFWLRSILNPPQRKLIEQKTK